MMAASPADDPRRQGTEGAIVSLNVQTQQQTIANSAIIASSGTPLSSNGSKTVTLNNASSIVKLIVNLTANPTGGTGTIQFTLQELDPQDRTTVLSGQAQPQSTALSAQGTDTNAVASDTASTVFNVSWTITAVSGTPSFAVNATLIGKLS